MSLRNHRRLIAKVDCEMRKLNFVSNVYNFLCAMNRKKCFTMKRGEKLHQIDARPIIERFLIFRLLSEPRAQAHDCERNLNDRFSYSPFYFLRLLFSI